MKSKLLLLLHILIILFITFGCAKKDKEEQSSDGQQGANSAHYYLANSEGKIIAEQITTIFDGRLFKFTNGPYFVLSGRNDYANAFSAQLPMHIDDNYYGMNCKFAADDCSGPCLIDANHTKPVANSLLIANEQEHLQGKADHVYHYTDQPVVSKVVQTNSRLELYGFGPHCQKIDSILDNYYSLDNISWMMPDLHNQGFHVITAE